MKWPYMTLLVGSLLLLNAGCEQRQQVSTTTGNIEIECDEAFMPVMRLLTDEFQRRYPESVITLVPTEARSAVVNFANDSTRMIVIDRPLNTEETEALQSANVDYRSYKIALSAVAVIVNSSNPIRDMTTGQLDSILGGSTFRWPAQRGTIQPVQLALCDPNSSTNEIVRTKIMGGREFSPAARYFKSPDEVVSFVKDDPGAIGIVPLSRLQETDQTFRILRLGDPAHPPDSTQAPGTFYGPAQAHVYRDYYPLSTQSYIYNRELLRTVGLGLISFINGIEGQKIIQKSGLVPATMPIRLVETTSTQVTTQ